MDDADRAESVIEQVIADGMARARKMAERVLPVTGQCLWCAEPIVGRPFCSLDCCRDYENEQAARRRNGK